MSVGHNFSHAILVGQNKQNKHTPSRNTQVTALITQSEIDNLHTLIRIFVVSFYTSNMDLLNGNLFRDQLPGFTIVLTALLHSVE
jgi:hypothetical protein